MNCHHSGFTRTSFWKEIHWRHNQSNHALFCWEDKAKIIVSESLIHFQPVLKITRKKKIITHIIYGSHSLFNPEKTKLKSEFSLAMSFKIPHTHSYQLLLHFIPKGSSKTSSHISFLNSLSFLRLSYFNYAKSCSYPLARDPSFCQLPDCQSS